MSVGGEVCIYYSTQKCHIARQHFNGIAIECLMCHYLKIKNKPVKQKFPRSVWFYGQVNRPGLAGDGDEYV